MPGTRKSAGCSARPACSSATDPAARPASSSTSASVLTVGVSKICDSGSVAPKRSSMAANRLITSSECPPGRRTPRRPSPPPRRAARGHSSARIISVGVDGSRPVGRALVSGSGRASRSSLPFALCGSSSTATNTAAPSTQVGGRRSVAEARRSWACRHRRPPTPRAVRRESRRRPRDGGVRGDGRFDVAQLDADPPQLHLGIAPAEVLEHAVSAPPHHVSRAVPAPCFHL